MNDEEAFTEFPSINDLNSPAAPKQRGTSMQMVKQRPMDDGSIAMDCGVCVIAMLADSSYEKVLTDNPHYRTTSDHEWMHYLNLLGFQVDQVQDERRLSGSRLYCAIIANLNEKEIHHAIPVDELDRIFDPANGAPEPGSCTLEQCVTHGTFKIHSCFAVRDRRLM